MKATDIGLALGTGVVAFCAVYVAGEAQQTPEELRPLLEPIRQKHDLPALAGAIVTSRGLVAVGVVGVRKYGDRTPATINDQFHLGSDTKAMTAVLLALLVEEGTLSWRNTLEQVFPDLASKMNPAYRGVTIDQLLSHRAGFSEESAPKGETLLDVHHLLGTAREQRSAYVAKILTEPPVNEPGKTFLYSNRSYAVGGAVAERAANDSWEGLMRKRLFQPLGMNSCGFGAMGTPGKIDEPWQHRVERGLHQPIGPTPLADNPAAIGPAATVHCSIGDWAKFIQAHLAGERDRPGLLKPGTFKRLHTPPYDDYAFGWIVTERPWAGGRALTHVGSNTQNYAVAWLAPGKDFAVLVATNQADQPPGDTPQACDETATALVRYFQPSK